MLFNYRALLPAARKRAGETPTVRNYILGDNVLRGLERHHLLGRSETTSEEVGAVALRFFEGLLVTPAADFFVVAAEENFWDVPAAKGWRASVMRIVEDAVILVTRNW